MGKLGKGDLLGGLGSSVEGVGKGLGGLLDGVLGGGQTKEAEEKK